MNIFIQSTIIQKEEFLAEKTKKNRLRRARRVTDTSAGRVRTGWWGPSAPLPLEGSKSRTRSGPYVRRIPHFDVRSPESGVWWYW